MSFHDYDLDPRPLKTLTSQGITEPTPVQAKSFGPALEGRDLIAVAQTGTGKTLAFGLPSITRLAELKISKNTMLVLTPTRELAVQVHDVLKSLARDVGLRSTCIYGGVGMEPQTKALRRGVSIIVATPGRLLDHMNQGHINYRDLSVLVLDEADRMLDMGFLPDIKRILSALPKDRQTLMFSATFPKTIQRLARDFQKDPVRIEVGRSTAPAKDIRQGVYSVDQKAKPKLLMHLLHKDEVESTIVFVRTKHRTDRIAKNLKREGLKAAAIHGDRTQRQRQQAIDGFRRGDYQILVATDVAARGLDVDGITHVINFDMPMTPDDYIHRIGRTARAGASGDALTFVCPDQRRELNNLEKSIGTKLNRENWDGSYPEFDTSDAPKSDSPRRSRSNRNSGRNEDAARSDSNRSGAPSKRKRRPGPRKRSDRPANSSSGNSQSKSNSSSSSSTPRNKPGSSQRRRNKARQERRSQAAQA